MGRLTDKLNKQNQQEISQNFSPGKMIGNIPSSAGQFVGGIKEAITHPAQTIKGLGQLGAGAIQSIPGVSEFYTKRATETGKLEQLQKNRQVFQNVKNFFIDRYGSPQKALKSLEKDPVGVAVDLSTLISGAGSILKSAKLSKLGTITEPVTATAKTVKTILKPPLKGVGILGKESLGVSTGAGGETLRTAFESAKVGGSKYSQALRGQISQQDVLNIAKEGLQGIKNQRSIAYQTQLQSIKGFAKQLNLDQIKSGIKKSLSNYNIKVEKGGKLNFSKSTIADTAEQKRISNVINGALNWTDNTPIGIDTLKRRLSDFYTPSGQGRALTNSIYSSIDNLLKKEVPGYTEMVKGYGEVSQLINELEKTLSLKTGLNIDTTLKKLTSALRRDSDFKRELLTKLDDATKGDVAGQIAGAILNPVVPSGLIGRSIFASGPVAALFTGVVNPSAFLSVALSSPRVIGEFLNVLGVGSRYADNIIKFLRKIKLAETARTTEKALFQAGRLETLKSQNPTDNKNY